MKNTKKLVVFKGYFYLKLNNVKHIKIHILLIVAWPEPKLLGGWSPNHFGPMAPGIYWVSPESSCHCENDSNILLRPKHKNIGERDKRLSTFYLELQIILDFWLF
jgi:hypothetical protein